MMNLSKSKRLLPLIFILLLSSAYFIPLNSEPMMVDKKLIIDPLLDINSFSDYAQAHFKGILYDFQPIRDMSHIFDIKISKSMGWKQFPLLHNFLLLLLLGIISFKVFNHYFVKNVSIFLSSIYLAHPATFNTFVEFTSRKHILSLIFFLISFYLYLISNKNKKNIYLSYLAHLMSLLSQPINGFGFMLIAGHGYFIKKHSIKKCFLDVLPYAIISFVTILINIWHYKLFHYSKEGVPDLNHTFDLVRILYGIAMHYRSFFIPFIYSRFYDDYTIINLLAIFIIPFIYWISIKKNKTITLFSLCLTVPTMFILYGHKSNILNLLFQTYYGLPTAFSFLLLMGGILTNRVKNSYFLILIPLIIISNFYGYIRKDRFLFLKSLARIEPECRTVQSTLTFAFEQNKPKIVNELADYFVSKKCRFIGYDFTNKHVFTNTMLIYFSNDFTAQEKENLFLKKFINKEDSAILIAAMEVDSRGKTEKFYKYIKLLKNSKVNSVFFSYTYIGEKLLDSCKNDNNIGCDYVREYHNKFKGKTATMRWNQNIENTTPTELNTN